MKKPVIGALVGAVVLAVAAVAIASPTLTQTADVDLTSGKTGKSVGVRADLQTTDPGAQPPGNVPAAINVKLTLPSGTRVNSNARPQCNLSETDVSNNRCPANTRIGSGSAVANVVFSSNGPVVTDVPATVTAYNRRGALAFRVVSQAQGTLPSVTIPIIGKISKKGVLNVPVPVLHPAGPTSKVILTAFKVNITKKSKTIRKNGKRKRINFITSPTRCTGTWTTTDVHTYDDGDSRTIRSTQPCRRS